MNAFNHYVMKHHPDYFTLNRTQQEKYRVDNRAAMEFPFTQFLCERLLGLIFPSEQAYLDHVFNPNEKRRVLAQLQHLRGIGENAFYIDDYANREPLYTFRTLYDFDESRRKNGRAGTLNYHLTGGLLRNGAGESEFHYFNHMLVEQYVSGVVRQSVRRWSGELDKSGLTPTQCRLWTSYMARYFKRIYAQMEKVRPRENDERVWVFSETQESRNYSCYVYGNIEATKKLRLRHWQSEIANLEQGDTKALELLCDTLVLRCTKFLTRAFDKVHASSPPVIVPFRKPMKVAVIDSGRAVDRLSLVHKKEFGGAV
jgi:hypothetical protein